MVAAQNSELVTICVNVYSYIYCNRKIRLQSHIKYRYSDKSMHSYLLWTAIVLFPRFAKCYSSLLVCKCMTVTKVSHSLIHISHSLKTRVLQISFSQSSNVITLQLIFNSIARTVSHTLNFITTLVF